MKIILFNALERNDKGILSPLGLFAELEDFVKRTSERNCRLEGSMLAERSIVICWAVASTCICGSIVTAASR
jgi:hypothetical protein